MIGYLEGNIIYVEEDHLLLLAGGVGYEIVVNSHILAKIRKRYAEDNHLSLYIYYHQTERQPKPVLLGFVSLLDKEFFQLFITVDAIGPLKAIKALEKPVNEVARAIENKDVTYLSTLSGIGKRSAEKIIAQLNGKVHRFITDTDSPSSPDEKSSDRISQHINEQVFDVLVGQLGHSPAQARLLIEKACQKKSDITTPEALFDTIFKED